MAEHRISIDIAASPDEVFALWMDLDRMTEWVGGVTRVTDVSGPIDVAGTRYTVRFGPMKSPTEILEVDRPHHVRTRFGSLILKGESDVQFEPIPNGTRLTQVFRTRGSSPPSWVACSPPARTKAASKASSKHSARSQSASRSLEQVPRSDRSVGRSASGCAGAALALVHRLHPGDRDRVSLRR